MIKFSLPNYVKPSMFALMFLLGASSFFLQLTMQTRTIGSAKLPAGQTDPVVEFEKLKGDLKNSKQAMCSFLLTQVSNEEVKLTLEKVIGLFEQALDHMGKSAEYAALIRPHVNPKVIEEFDRNGSSFVLEVSESVRQVSIEYKAADNAGANEEEKYLILEKYFYKACANKLGTVIAEKSMFDSFQNMEAKLRARAALHQ